MRQQRRRALGTLKALSVKKGTRERYDRSLQKFFAYLQWHRFTLAATAASLDSQLEAYVENLWHEGDSRYLASDTVAAVQDVQPELRKALPRSWRVLKKWARHELPVRAPPLTQLWVHAICGWFCHSGMSSTALAVHLAFAALLRTGEMLGLRSKHIVASTLQGKIVLNLQVTKTSHKDAVMDSVVITDHALAWHLRAWQAKVSTDAFLVPMSGTTFRSHFSAALQNLQLSHFPFKPYSLRRGGATALFQTVQSFSKVCHAGRWQSEKTCRLYVNDASAALSELKLPVFPHREQFAAYWRRQLQLVYREQERFARGRGRK